jgi:hypothetical protein
MESPGHTSPSTSEQKRRSSRVLLSVPILISGPDFEVEGETTSRNRTVTARVVGITARRHEDRWIT